VGKVRLISACKSPRDLPPQIAKFSTSVKQIHYTALEIIVYHRWYWLNMNTLYLGLFILFVVVIIAFIIYLILEMIKDNKLKKLK